MQFRQPRRRIWKALAQSTLRKVQTFLKTSVPFWSDRLANFSLDSPAQKASFKFRFFLLTIRNVQKLISFYGTIPLEKFLNTLDSLFWFADCSNLLSSITTRFNLLISVSVVSLLLVEDFAKRCSLIFFLAFELWQARHSKFFDSYRSRYPESAVWIFVGLIRLIRWQSACW